MWKKLLKMAESNLICNICIKLVRDNAKSVLCDVCKTWIHTKCSKINNKEFTIISEENYIWYCKKCIASMFPYSNIDNTDLAASIKCIDDVKYDLYESCMKLNHIGDLSNTKELNFEEVDINNLINYNASYYTEDDFNCKFTARNKDLKIVHINCRSMRANFDKLKLFVSQTMARFDIIAISETWLNDYDDLKQYDLDQYNAYYCSRHGKAGGGVALYIKSELQQKKIQDVKIANVFEYICAEILLTNCKKIIIGTIYRAPNADHTIFNDQLKNIIMLQKNKTFYLCGDFNIDLLKIANNNYVSNFLDLMYSNGLYPLINKPTRITAHSKSIIDNIYTSELVVNNTSGLIINDISDHLPVFTVCNYRHDKYVDVSVKSKQRTYNELTIGKLVDDLSGIDWEEICVTDDVDVCYDSFMSVLDKKINVNCPVKYGTNKKIKNKPWMSKALLVSCKRKNLLYKQFLRRRNNVSEITYKNYKNKLSGLLRKAEKLYYTELLDSHKSNAKETWKTINEITNRKRKKISYPSQFIKNAKEISGNTNIANLFNDFFVGIGPSLAKNIPSVNKSFSDYIRCNIEDTIFINPTNDIEVLNIVMDAKNKYSCGHDNLSMNLVKSIILCILKPLVHIFNLSLLQGIFPAKMKIACVLPLYKAGDTQDVSNYRPVSLLPQFSKILEKLFNKRLIDFVKKLNILYLRQYGFRDNMSTAMAIFELTEAITTSLDKKESTIGVFIDLKKAFDTIDHSLLLKKLALYGIRGIALDWLTSYLSDRSQYVKFNNEMSSCKSIICGVPQGSILGPTLFILYVNDMCNVSDVLKCILFADDTNLFYTGNNIDDMCNVMSSELEKLNLWFKVNKLSLNVKKTNFMLFSQKRAKNDLRIAIDNHNLDRVEVTKFLGVYIDSNLNWLEHIAHVKKKIAIGLSVLHRVKGIVNPSALYALYCTIILPHLMYCSEIWGQTYAYVLKPLSVLQKRAVRVICGANNYYRDHTKPMFQKYKLLNIYDIITYKSMCFMYKVKYNLLPINLQCMFDSTEDRHNHNTRQVGNFAIKSCRTVKKSLCLSIKGPKIWNTLPQNIKSSRTLNTFKKTYKVYLLNM